MDKKNLAEKLRKRQERFYPRELLKKITDDQILADYVKCAACGKPLDVDYRRHATVEAFIDAVEAALEGHGHDR